ncbi:inner membrane protein YiaA [Lederbergia graminis]|uniref:Inner membrane protein YiaA n=1 Tax=Lederbergia graminis TaxID=735518 RepID=A0ABW0LEJ8_9BACI
MSENNEDVVAKEEKTGREVVRREGEPTGPFKAAAWGALFVGVISYLIGLYNSNMELNEQGYYFSVLVFGLFAAVSLQKSVRDRDEGIPVTNIYYGVSWFALIIAIALMAIGLYNAGSIVLSEKGFFGMAYVLSIFAAITVQKNVRDTQRAREME